MNVYHILFICTLCLTFVEFFVSINKRKILFVFLGVISTLMAMLKDNNSAVDLDAYNRIFYDINTYDYIVSIVLFDYEPGYVLLNSVVYNFISDFNVFLATVGVLIFLPINYFIYKKSTSPCLSFLLFVGLGFYYQANGVLRMWCAMAILLFSYKYVINRNFFKFLAIIILASMFHRTAIFFIIIYWMYGINLNVKNFLMMFSMSILIFFISEYIVSVLTIFARNNEIVGIYRGGVNMYVLLSLLGISVCCMKIKDEFSRLMATMIWGTMILQPLAMELSNLARVVSEYSIAIIFLVPSLLNYNKRITDSVLIKVLLCILISEFFFNAEMYEYNFFF